MDVYKKCTDAPPPTRIKTGRLLTYVGHPGTPSLVRSNAGVCLLSQYFLEYFRGTDRSWGYGASYGLKVREETAPHHRASPRLDPVQW